MAYYSIEPFGAERDNIHMAMIASILCNVNRTKESKEYTAEQFMIGYKDVDNC